MSQNSKKKQLNLCLKLEENPLNVFKKTKKLPSVVELKFFPLSLSLTIKTNSNA